MVPPDSHRVSRAPWYSGTRPEPATFRLQDCHLLWCAVPGISARLLVCDSMWPSPTTPVRPKPVRFGLIRVRSPLLTESLLFSLPRGTEMVHFPRFALPSYGFRRQYMSSAHVGSPIRKSTDQRMLAPHRSLSQLATSFIASKCQGIHRVPLVA